MATAPAAPPANAPTDEIKISIYKPTIENFKIKMFAYGPPGVGKTTFGVSAGDHELTRDVLFINIESGLLSVSHRMQNCDVVDYTGIQSLQDVCWFLIKSKHKYKTVVIDSLSELQMVNIEDIVKAEVAAKRNANRVSADDIWQEDYKASTAQLRRVVRGFRDLPMHVLFIAHDTVAGQDANSPIVPALTPKLRQSVVGMVDIVGYMFTKEENNELQRKMLVQPAGRFLAKDRSPGGRLGKIVDNPSIPLIMDKLIGKEVKTG